VDAPEAEMRFKSMTTKRITASEYAAQQAQIVAQLIQSGKMPSLEQVEAAVAVARENLKKKIGAAPVQSAQDQRGR
jgi:hypothetical protein